MIGCCNGLVLVLTLGSGWVSVRVRIRNGMGMCVTYTCNTVMLQCNINAFQNVTNREHWFEVRGYEIFSMKRDVLSTEYLFSRVFVCLKEGCVVSIRECV